MFKKITAEEMRKIETESARVAEFAEKIDLEDGLDEDYNVFGEHAMMLDILNQIKDPFYIACDEAMDKAIEESKESIENGEIVDCNQFLEAANMVLMLASVEMDDDQEEVFESRAIARYNATLGMKFLPHLVDVSYELDVKFNDPIIGACDRSLHYAKQPYHSGSNCDTYVSRALIKFENELDEKSIEITDEIKGVFINAATDYFHDVVEVEYENKQASLPDVEPTPMIPAPLLAVADNLDIKMDDPIIIAFANALQKARDKYEHGDTVMNFIGFAFSRLDGQLEITDMAKSFFNEAAKEYFFDTINMDTGLDEDSILNDPELQALEKKVRYITEEDKEKAAVLINEMFETYDILVEKEKMAEITAVLSQDIDLSVDVLGQLKVLESDEFYQKRMKKIHGDGYADYMKQRIKDTIVSMKDGVVINL